MRSHDTIWGYLAVHGMRGLKRDGFKIAGTSVCRDLRGSHEVQHIVEKDRAGQDSAVYSRTRQDRAV